MVEKVTESIFYVGANDHDLDLFEGRVYHTKRYGI